MSHAFIDFLFTHHKLIAFRKYVVGAQCAEEHFYITLFHLPEAPIGNAPFHKAAVGQIWVLSGATRLACDAAVRHDICVAGVGTMKLLHSRGEFFYNKYLEKEDHVIMDCAEKRIVEKNKLEYAKDCSENKTSFV